MRTVNELQRVAQSISFVYRIRRSIEYGSNRLRFVITRDRHSRAMPTLREEEVSESEESSSGDAVAEDVAGSPIASVSSKGIIVEPSKSAEPAEESSKIEEPVVMTNEKGELIIVQANLVTLTDESSKREVTPALGESVDEPSKRLEIHESSVRQLFTGSPQGDIEESSTIGSSSFNYKQDKLQVCVHVQKLRILFQVALTAIAAWLLNENDGNVCHHGTG